MSVTVDMPDLYPRQREAMYPPTRHSVVEGSTKSGKTGAAMIWQIGQAIEKGGAHAWFSPVKSQARAAFYRVAEALPETQIDDHETYRRITIPRVPAAIYYLSSDTPKRIYGKEFESVVVDEASRIDEEQWSTIRTLAAPKSAPIRAIGNVRDRSNWHYRQARKAEAGELDDWTYVEMHWTEAVESELTPVTREDIESLRADLPEHLEKSLLENEPAAAATNPFGGREAIEAAAVPMSPGEPCAYGVDLARVEDYTVVVGLEPSGEPASFHRFQAPWDETVRRVCQILDAPACVDQTGVGDGLLPRFREQTTSAVHGVKMSAQTKRSLYESLATGLGDAEVRILDDRQVLREFAGIETTATRSGYRYESGADHDDCVDAWALALRAYRQRRIRPTGTDDAGGTAIDVAGFEDQGW